MKGYKNVGFLLSVVFLLGCANVQAADDRDDSKDNLYAGIGACFGAAIGGYAAYRAAKYLDDKANPARAEERQAQDEEVKRLRVESFGYKIDLEALKEAYAASEQSRLDLENNNQDLTADRDRLAGQNSALKKYIVGGGGLLGLADLALSGSLK